MQQRYKLRTKSSKEKFFIRIEKFSKLIFQIVGFNLIPINKTGDYYILWKFYLKIWSFLMLLGVFIAAAVAINFHDYVFSDSFVGKANDVVKSITVYIAFSISLIEAFFHQDKYEKLYEKFREFKKVCSMLNVKFEKYYHRMRFYYGWRFILLFISSIAIEIIIIISIGFSRQWQYFWISNLIPIVACKMRNLQYFYYVNFIHHQVHIINDELSKIVNYTYWNLTSRNVHKLMLKIQTLKNSHGIVYRSTSIINEIYSFSLASLIVHQCIQSGCDFYWMHSIFMDYYRENAHIAVILPSTVPLIFVFFCLHESEMVEMRATKITVLLNGIRRNKDDEKLMKLVSLVLKLFRCCCY